MSIDERHLEKRLVDQHLNLMLFIKKKAQTRNGAGIHPEALCELLRASKGYVSATNCFASALEEKLFSDGIMRRQKRFLAVRKRFFMQKEPYSRASTRPSSTVMMGA